MTSQIHCYKARTINIEYFLQIFAFFTVCNHAQFVHGNIYILLPLTTLACFGMMFLAREQELQQVNVPASDVYQTVSNKVPAIFSWDSSSRSPPVRLCVCLSVTQLKVTLGTNNVAYKVAHIVACNVLQHLQFATLVIFNTCNLQITPVSTMEVKRALPCEQGSPSPEG